MSGVNTVPPAARFTDPAQARFTPSSMPVEAYISAKYAGLEDERVWPRTWQIVCREEEIPNVGDFVTFNLVEESIIVIRSSEDEVQAFYNVCRHRGRRLVDAERGNRKGGMVCGFHGWSWNPDGSSKHVTDREDWSGCDRFADEDLKLRSVRIEKWAGWYWICMDPTIEPLLDYLEPLPDVFRNFELESMRIAWYKTLIVPVNWKVMIDAFNEGYHTSATHPQVGKRSPFGTTSGAAGKHSTFTFPNPQRMVERMISSPPDTDHRVQLHDALKDTYSTLHSLVSRYRMRAGERLVEELPDGMPLQEVAMKLGQFHREEVEKSGAKWPEKLTQEDTQRAGTDWHMFPNSILLPTADCVLWYRSRPNGADHTSCIWDVWSLERFAEGEEPSVKREHYPTLESFKGQNPFLEQDFSNVAAVQVGMRSRGFTEARTSPLQEVPINNFHTVLYQYLATPPDETVPEV